MKLKDCTKEELLFIIERMGVYSLSNTDYYLRQALGDVEEHREEKRRAESKRLLAYTAEKQREYIRLLEPYYGKLISDIPLPVLEQADAALNEARAADSKWMKLMGIRSATSRK